MNQDGAAKSPADGKYVFLSYARADEKTAKGVIKLIEQAGLTVWWDGLIPGGDRFSARISEALEGAAAIVVLWSSQSRESNWVQDEAAFARGHHRLVPVLIDGSEPPLGFRQLQCIDLSKSGLRPSNPAVKRLLETICEMTGRLAEVDDAQVEREIRLGRDEVIGRLGDSNERMAGKQLANFRVLLAQFGIDPDPDKAETRLGLCRRTGRRDHRLRSDRERNTCKRSRRAQSKPHAKCRHPPLPPRLSTLHR